MAAPEEVLRKRRPGDTGPVAGSPPAPQRDPAGCPVRLRAGTFWLTRIALLKALAFVYCVAFLVAFQQNKQLIGTRGLLPCRLYLESIQRHFHGRVGWDALSYAPTVLWLLDWSDMDSALDTLALLGLGISSFVMVTGCANMVLMSALWALYMSLVSVGQVWYSFGWESQLLETGFLGIFLCPLWTLSPLPRRTPTSRIVIWGFRWLIFRIMLGAGLIKLRGDRCWRDLTCMDFHYETQAVSSSMSSGWQLAVDLADVHSTAAQAFGASGGAEGAPALLAAPHVPHEPCRCALPARWASLAVPTPHGVPGPGSGL